MRSRWRLVAALLLVGCVPSFPEFGGCNGVTYISDSFDEWCGDLPCGWEAEGEVERVGTWHRGDYGLALQSDEVTISTSCGSEDEERPICTDVVLLADIDEDAEVKLSIDLMGDDVVEMEEDIPALAWEPYRFKVLMPSWFDRCRLIVTKRGGGSAVFGYLAMGLDDLDANNPSCPGGISIDFVRPLGAPCEMDEECENGLCYLLEYDYEDSGVSACRECSDSTDCSSDHECIDQYGEYGDYLGCEQPVR